MFNDKYFEVKWVVSWDRVKELAELTDEQLEELKDGAEEMAGGFKDLITETFWEGVKAIKRGETEDGE